MDLVKFPVQATTIFPVANSRAGGQLLTEWNQLSRESVANHSNINYICGPSYTHSLDDFKISSRPSHPDVLYISGGCAIVHGHFVYLDIPSDSAISIPMSEVGLTGNLCVGLRAMYDNPNTLAASLKTEDAQDYYEGIQVVILPASDFHLPEGDGISPTPVNQVTAHLKLGEFTYQNNVISNVQPNETRHQCLDGERISNIDKLLASRYVTKTGLDIHKLYVMSGKSDGDPTVSADYWADATGSMMMWDVNPQVRSENDSKKAIWLEDGQLLQEAKFRYDSSTDDLKLVLPHKQIDGMTSLGSNPVPTYYAPKEVVVPAANRATGSGGVLDKSWVNFLNGLDDKIATMYRMPGGKMRKFIEILTDKSNLPQPPIGIYEEQDKDASYYDTRLQYSFNLLQTQVAQLDSKFLEFQQKLESEWTSAVTADVTADVQSQAHTLQANVDAMKTDLANFQGDLASLTDGINNTVDGMIAASDKYTSLANRVTTLENQWFSTQSVTPTDVDAQQNTDIDELKNRISAIETAINQLSTNTTELINNTTSQLNTLYQNLYGANKDGSSGDIRDANTSIEQLRSQYDYLYDAIHDLYDGITSEVEKASASTYDRLFAALRSEIDAQIAAISEQYNVTANWAPGDYVLVAQDMTVATDTSSANAAPSTMYVVVPGLTQLDSQNIASYYDVYITDLSTPISRVSPSSGSAADPYNDAIDTYTVAVDTLKRQVPSKFVFGYELGSNDVQELASEDELPDVYNSSVMLDELYNSNVIVEGVRGTPGKDYFVLRYRYPIGETSISEGVQYQTYRWVRVFFTLDHVLDKLELDINNPIILSGGTPYAEESRIGGFLNVPADVYGAGYVSRDDEGHLRLNDFELLAAGVSAYQLGEDRVEGAGLDISELQEVFDQYVNQRIAFPNANQLYRASLNQTRTDVITIDLNISSTAEGTLNIYDIDSRFNTALHLKISGSATENVVINIQNCQRLRISLDPTSSPTILLNNVCLYYDADILDRVSIIKNLSLWYSQFESTDPLLEVDGMTVIYSGKLEPKGSKNFWTYASGNDNSYAYALRQLTFASDGTIIGMGVAITDNTTTNIMPVGESIFAATFTLPQSIGLSYPASRLKKQIKVTGNFVTAYRNDSTPMGYSVKDTTFTILTQKYLTYSNVNELIQGVISFFTRTTFIEDVNGVDNGTLIALSSVQAIDGWESGAYHIFYGGAVE